MCLAAFGMTLACSVSDLRHCIQLLFAILSRHIQILFSVTILKFFFYWNSCLKKKELMP